MYRFTTDEDVAGSRWIVHEWDAVGGHEERILRSVERAIRMSALTESETSETESDEWLFDAPDGRLMRAGEIVEIAGESGAAGAMEGRFVARSSASPAAGHAAAPPFVMDEGTRLVDRVRAMSPGLESVRRLRLRRSTRILTQDGREVAALHADRVEPIVSAEWNGSGRTPSFFRIRLETTEIDTLSMRLLIRLLDRTERLDRSVSPGEIPIGRGAGDGAEPSASQDSVPAKRSAATPTRDYVNAILADQLAKVAGNLSGARFSDDPSHVHDIRVACQRMRAVLRLFRRALPPEAAALRSELAWLRDALGGVRDVDVQAEKFAEIASEWIHDRSTLREIEARIAEEHDRRCEEMDSALDSERLERLLAAVGGFAATGHAPEEARAMRPIARAVPKLLRKLHRDVERRLDALGKRASFDDVHLARIRLKSLRYLLEFVEPVYGKKTRRPVAALRRIQDRLGEIQDEVVMVDLLRELATTAPRIAPPTAFALGRLAERHATRAARLKARSHRAAAELRDARLAALEARSRTVRAKLS